MPVALAIEESFATIDKCNFWTHRWVKKKKQQQNNKTKQVQKEISSQRTTSYKYLYFTCWSVNVAQRWEEFVYNMRETSVLSLVKIRSIKQVFTALGKKISCHRLQAPAVQVRHRQEKAENSLENDLDVYLINRKIIVFNSPTALFLFYIFVFFMGGRMCHTRDILFCGGRRCDLEWQTFNDDIRLWPL